MQLKGLNSERGKTFKAYYDCFSKFTEAKENIVNKTNELNTLKENSNHFKDQINEVNAQIRGISARIPELEAEKKTYVTSRNFKVTP